MTIHYCSKNNSNYPNTACGYSGTFIQSSEIKTDVTCSRCFQYMDSDHGLRTQLRNYDK